MAETIKTVTVQYDLKKRTGDAVEVIAPVTAGPVTYGLWNEKKCANPEEDKNIQKIVARVNREEQQGVLPRASTFDFDVERAPRADGQPPLFVVAEIGVPPLRKP